MRDDVDRESIGLTARAIVGGNFPKQILESKTNPATSRGIARQAARWLGGQVVRRCEIGAYVWLAAQGLLGACLLLTSHSGWVLVVASAVGGGLLRLGLLWPERDRLQFQLDTEKLDDFYLQIRKLLPWINLGDPLNPHSSGWTYKEVFKGAEERLALRVGHWRSACRRDGINSQFATEQLRLFWDEYRFLRMMGLELRPGEDYLAEVPEPAPEESPSEAAVS